MEKTRMVFLVAAVLSCGRINRPDAFVAPSGEPAEDTAAAVDAIEKDMEGEQDASSPDISAVVDAAEGGEVDESVWDVVVSPDIEVLASEAACVMTTDSSGDKASFVVTRQSVAGGEERFLVTACSFQCSQSSDGEASCNQPPTNCSKDTHCGDLIACTTGACIEGLCYQTTDDQMCSASQRCVDTQGCLPACTTSNDCGAGAQTGTRCVDNDARAYIAPDAHGLCHPAGYCLPSFTFGHCADDEHCEPGTGCVGN